MDREPNDLWVFDGHNDVLQHVAPFAADDAIRFVRGDGAGHLDLPRAEQGGFGAGFFAVFAPSVDGGDLTITDGAYEVSLPSMLDRDVALTANLAMIAGLFRVERASGGRLRMARSVADIHAARAEGAIAAILHLEGAEAIDPALDTLEALYQAGLRSLGPVWSRPNRFGHGVPFRFPSSPDTGPGLTDAGRELVRACNELGILVDVSHLNARGFDDVAAITGAPIVATHSAAWAICPVSRNLTDRQLDVIRDSHGMVGVNFEVSATRPDGHDQPDTPLSVIADHIVYMAERIGIDRVGFGSDFDGATMPAALGDVAGLPRLITALRERGFDDAALRKVTHDNWLRVLTAIWHPPR